MTVIKNMASRVDKSRNPAILFFTDGQSAVHMEPLKELKEKFKLSCPIHTYGFGQYNSLNSKSLYEIS
jgi:hypothetical protein